MQEKTKKYIAVAVGTSILLANRAYAHPGIFILKLLPMVFFACLHYLILRKMLNQYPTFAGLRPQNIPAGSSAVIIGFYSMMFVLSFVAFFSLILISHIKPIAISLLSESTNKLVGPGILVLLFATITTGALSLFSHHFFAKPFKETWKAILLAGLMAGAATCALAYGLLKGLGPYLPANRATGKQVES